MKTAKKVAYVKRQGQTRDHTCHWPGCGKQVPPAVWGCKEHWQKLPSNIRNNIWSAFNPGQEVNLSPSRSYMVAAREAQDWIAAQPKPRKVLRDYQMAAMVKFEKKDSAYWAMQMRLGKTLTVIRFLDSRGYKRNIIVAPKTVLISWEIELRDEGLLFLNISDMPNKKRATILFQKDWAYHYFLINYEAFANSAVVQAIANNDFDSITCDEATCIANHRNKATLGLIYLSDTVKFRACLSGTPTPEEWWQVWSQMAFLNRGSWMGYDNFYRWQNEYYKKDPLGYGWFLTPQSAKAIKKVFHEEAFCLTRAQAGIGEEKIYQIRRGKLEGEQKRVYNHIRDFWELPNDLEKHAVYDPEAGSTVFRPVIETWARRVLGGTLPDGEPINCWKYSELVNIAKNELPDEKLVVWFAFNDEIKRARLELSAVGIKAEVIHGGTTIPDRRSIISRFRDGKINHVLVQVMCGRFGLDFSASSTTIYFSNHYSNLARIQSEDRVVKVGKKDPLLYIDFTTEDTLEVELYDRLRNKKIDSTGFLKPPKNLAKR